MDTNTGHKSYQISRIKIRSNQVLIYRLEDSRGRGYRRTGSEDSIDTFTKDFMHYTLNKPYYNIYYNKRRPIPQKDGLTQEDLLVSHLYHYGFSNLKDLKRYFNHNELIAALIYGSVICCYKVEEQYVIPLKHQVMFIKDHAIKLSPQNILDYLEEDINEIYN